MFRTRVCFTALSLFLFSDNGTMAFNAQNTVFHPRGNLVGWFPRSVSRCCHRRYSHGVSSTARSMAATGSNKPDHDEGEKAEDSNASGDKFYHDLQQAKASKLGAYIPEEQLKASAAQAESDFLEAMKSTKDEFKQAKQELGPEGAVDMFLDRLRKGDEEKTHEEEQSDGEDEVVGEFQ